MSKIETVARNGGAGHMVARYGVNMFGQRLDGFDSYHAVRIVPNSDKRASLR